VIACADIVTSFVSTVFSFLPEILDLSVQSSLVLTDFLPLFSFPFLYSHFRFSGSFSVLRWLISLISAILIWILIQSIGHFSFSSTHLVRDIILIAILSFGPLCLLPQKVLCSFPPVEMAPSLIIVAMRLLVAINDDLHDVGKSQSDALA
jgi:hypothetical protein